jgi:GntR family transcriptional repressor for pyruvate dehydrogenase complex
LENLFYQLAATRAIEIDRRAIKTCISRMKKAHNFADSAQEACDIDLHLLIHEGAHNVVLMHVMRVFSDLLQKGIFYNREQLYHSAGVREALFSQHVAIAEAILAGHPSEAVEAALAHINYSSNAVKEIREDEQRTAL